MSTETGYFHWLGHHSPAFTLDAYVHLLPDDLPDTVFLDVVTGVPEGGEDGAEENPTMSAQ